jgi:RNA polymerase sigma-70 factor, ECF subfamily
LKDDERVTIAVPKELDLARLRRQDPGEFTRFVQLHERLVLGLFQTLGLSGANSDDAAAETFALAYRALPNFRADSQLSTWLYRIAYRTALKVRRRYPPPPTGQQPEQADPHVLAPSTAAETSESAAAIWKAVSMLDPDQAVAVELFYRRGMSVEEVAAILEKPSGTIKTLLFRARDRLRMLLRSLENS